MAAVAVALAITGIYFYHDWQHYLAVKTGSLNNSSTPPNYNYWSGFGSVFPWEIGAVAAMWTWVYQHGKNANCHTHRCWRLGSLPVENYKVCKKCHHKIKGTHPTIDHLKEVHSGGSGSNQGGDCQSGRCEHATCIVNISGVQEPGKSPDAPGVPPAPGL